MINIKSINDLINKLYVAYDKKAGLDFQAEIAEIEDIIQSTVTNKTDLNEVYVQIRRQCSSIPSPKRMIEIIKRCNKQQETKTYINDSENGKMMLFVCYKDGKCRDIREYVIQNGGNDRNTKTQSQVLKNLNDKFSYVKVMEFPESAVLYRDLLKFDENGSKIVGGEVWEIGGYDSNGDVTYYNKTRVA